jgi:hypothetical protein
MTQDNVPQLDILNGRLQIDPHSGAITSLRLSEPDTEFIARHTGAGLLRFALPLSGHSGHHVELGTHGQPRQLREDHLRNHLVGGVVDACA